MCLDFMNSFEGSFDTIMKIWMTFILLIICVSVFSMYSKNNKSNKKKRKITNDNKFVQENRDRRSLRD